MVKEAMNTGEYQVKKRMQMLKSSKASSTPKTLNTETGYKHESCQVIIESRIYCSEKK